MDTTPNLWQNGWWQPARRASSPNFSAREAGEKISLAVLHNISLPPFEYGTGAVEKLFTNSIDEAEHPFYSIIKDLRVSSHFFIARTGETVQFVSCNDTAYHAGVSSFDGREKCNGFSVGIEIEGCDFEPFTEAQYAYTDSPVTFQYGQSGGQANGMTYDHKTGLLNFPSKVKATIYDTKNL